MERDQWRSVLYFLARQRKLEHKGELRSHPFNKSVRSKIAEIMWIVDNSVGNRRIELVKDIEHIHFEKLILLDLWDNQINSIEALPRIHIPNLESL